VVAGGIVACAAGCSLIFPASATQCTKDGDCAARGFLNAACIAEVCAPAAQADSGPPDTSVADAFEYPKGWECLANVQWPTPTMMPMVLSQPLEDVLSTTPLPGVSMRPCGAADPDCTSPVGAATVSDDAGVGHFPLLNGFDGYVDVRREGGVPALVYVTPPLFSTANQYTADLITNSLFNQLVGLTVSTRDGGPVGIDPSAGHIFVYAEGCDWQSNLSKGASGVSFAFDRTGPNVGQAYFVGNVPGNTDRTDGSGTFVLVNMPPGPITLTAKLADSGLRVGSVAAYVRKGAATYLHVVPTP
jgi:hypothetical protein